MLNPIRPPLADPDLRLRFQAEGTSRLGTLRHQTSAPSSHPAERDAIYEDEIARWRQRELSLQDEIKCLKEIVVFLTVLDDREVAERVAARIRDEGLTDDLLSQINTMHAAQVAGRSNHNFLDATPKAGRSA